MTLREFIKQHRQEIDQCIERRLGHNEDKQHSNSERRLWILNDEGLYRWAQSEGVKI